MPKYSLWVQSVPITTKVVSSSPINGEVYSIQHYVIKFVSDLRQVGGFLWLLQFPPRYSWNIVESGVKHQNPNKTIPLSSVEVNNFVYQYITISNCWNGDTKFMWNVFLQIYM